MKKFRCFLVLLFSFFINQVTLADIQKANLKSLEEPVSFDKADAQKFINGDLGEESMVALTSFAPNDSIDKNQPEIASCETELMSLLVDKVPLQSTKIDNGYYYKLKNARNGVVDVYVFSRALKVKSVWRVKLVNDMLDHKVEKPVTFIRKCQSLTQGEFYIYKTTP